MALMKNELKLNLGSGCDYLEDVINIDTKPLEKIDLIWNIDQGLPFEDNSVVYIKAHDFLEHILDLEFVLKEMYRISKHKAEWNVRIPHYASDSAPSIQHKHFFTESAFVFFSPALKDNLEDSWNYGWNVWLKELDRQITFHNAALERFKNREELEFALIYYRNVIDSMTFRLQVIKDFQNGK